MINEIMDDVKQVENEVMYDFPIEETIDPEVLEDLQIEEQEVLDNID